MLDPQDVLNYLYDTVGLECPMEQRKRYWESLRSTGLLDPDVTVMNMFQFRSMEMMFKWTSKGIQFLVYTFPSPSSNLAKFGWCTIQFSALDLTW